MHKPQPELGQEAPREKLHSEVIFDKAVYGGISYFAQAAAGIAATYWLKHSSGKAQFEKVAQWLGPKVFKNRPIEQAVKEINSPLMVTSLVMMGNLFLLPVKWLEDRKPQVVHKIYDYRMDRKAAKGQTYSDEELKHHQECLGDLEKEPKQTWGSLLAGRVAGLIPVFATVFALGDKRNEAINQGATKIVANTLENVGLQKAAQSKMLNKVVHIGFMDMFYSAISAGGLYIYSHFIKPPAKKNAAIQVPDVATAASQLGATDIDSGMAVRDGKSPNPSFRDRVQAGNKTAAPRMSHLQRLLSQTGDLNLGSAL